MIQLHRMPVGLFLCLTLMLCTIGTAAALAQAGKEITLSPGVLQKFVGVYELAPTFKITITVEGSQLMAQATGQAKLPVYASSETKFFYKVVDAQIEFFQDDKGAVNHLVLQQNGREMKAPRTSDKVEKRKEITVSPTVLAQYVGTYDLAPNFKIMITLEGSQLMAQASGQGKAPLYASSETKFFYKVVDAEIEFFKDDKGAVSHLVLYQNNKEMKAPRTSSIVAEHKEITVSPAILAKYAGTYELKPGFDLVVTLEGDKLMVQATGQAKLPVYASSETKFFYKAVDAQIEFFKDDKGAVTHLMLHQGPTEVKAPKK